MTRIQRFAASTATGLFMLAGVAACSHGSIDVRGYEGYDGYYSVPGGYTQVDIIGYDGNHHRGYYDRNNRWHGGFYDGERRFHADANDWRHDRDHDRRR